MKREKKDASRRKLGLRKESLRQLDPAALEQVAGGFDIYEYLRRCMGTNYTVYYTS